MTSGTLSSMWLTQPPVLKGELFQDELKAHPQNRALLEFVSVSQAAVCTMLCLGSGLN